MALQFQDPCGLFYTALSEIWTTVTGTPDVVAAGGPVGADCIRCQHNGTHQIEMSLSGTPSKVGAHFDMFMDNDAGAGDLILAEWRDTGSAQCELRWINSTHALRVTRNGTTLGTTTATYNYDTWLNLQLEILCNDSTGTVELRVNGAVALSLSSQDTKNTANASFNTIRFGVAGGGSSGKYTRYSNIIVYDSTGSQCNSFPGPRVVECDFPTGAGDDTGFTPSAGSNWQNVDDAAQDGDTTYNSAASTATRDNFATSDLSIASGDVFAVQVVGRLRKEGAPAANAKLEVKSSSTIGQGSAIALSSTYATYRATFELDPATSAQWTVSGVNAAKIGYRYDT